MTTFIVTNKATGVEVYRYGADAPVEWSGMSFADHDHIPVPDEITEIVPRMTKFGGRRLLTKLEFRGLFKEAALKSIDRFEVKFEQVTFLTDDQKDEVRTGFKNYNAASDVNLDDPRWIPGLGLYVALGMLNQDDMLEVLNG